MLPIEKVDYKFHLRQYDDNLDDVRSILHDVCEILVKFNAQFIVVAPESGAWPVDVLTDLPVVIEQIPDFLRFLRKPNSEIFVLDFYEQGLERQIEVRQSNGILDIVCSHYGGSTKIEKSTGEVSTWYHMMLNFWKKFCGAVDVVASLAAKHRYWNEWTSNLGNE